MSTSASSSSSAAPEIPGAHARVSTDPDENKSEDSMILSPMRQQQIERDFFSKALQTAYTLRSSFKLFPLWQRRMRAVLSTAALESTIELPYSSQITITKEMLNAVTIIINGLEDNIAIQYVDMKQPSELWEKLNSTYNRITETTQSELRIELSNCIMKDGEDILDYVERLRTIQAKMISKQMKCDDSDIKHQLYIGLPRQQYGSAIGILKISKVSSLNEIIEHIKDASVLLKYDENKDEVHYSNADQQKKTNNYHTNNTKSGGSQIRCYNCNGIGHVQRDCKKEKKTKCEYCKKTNHVSEKCYFKPKPNNGGNESSMTNMIAQIESLKELVLSQQHQAYSVKDKSQVPYNKNVNKKTTPLNAVLDSGATRHLINDASLISSLQSLPNPISMVVANNNEMKLKHGGKIKLETSLGQPLVVAATHAPDCAQNLISISQLTRDNKAKVEIDENKAVIRLANGGHIVAPRQGNLYVINQQQNHTALSVNSDYHSNIQLWHERMGHISDENVHRLIDAAIGGKEINKGKRTNYLCIGCVKGKSHREPFARVSSATPPTSIMDMVVADLCGPIYGEYISLLEDVTAGYVWIRLIKRKSDAAQHVKDWNTQATTQTGRILKRFHSDGGTEYKPLKSYFLQQGTIMTTTTPDTPQHNGKAERTNRTILEITRALLFHAHLGKMFWKDALNTAVYIFNRLVPSSLTAKGITRYEAWYGSTPSISHMRVFGCDAYVHTLKKYRENKLSSTTKAGIFIRYDDITPGYYFIYDPITNRTYRSRDVTFDEHSFSNRKELQQLQLQPQSQSLSLEKQHQYEQDIQEINSHIIYKPSSSNEKKNKHIDMEEKYPEQEHDLDERQEEKSEEVLPQQQEQDESQQPEHKELSTSTLFPPLPATALVPSHFSLDPVSDLGMFPDGPTPWGPTLDPSNIISGPRNRHVQQSQNSILTATEVTRDRIINPVPQNYQEAINSQDKDKWESAMNSEYQSLIDNNSWTLTTLPHKRKAIASKWVFAYKYDADGNIIRHKARLVAKGFLQQEGIDYHDTFAPVMKYKSLRIILSLCTIYDYELVQMDVMTAFLNATLQEDVYMEQPQGYEQGHNLVCKLNKSVYGTKQAPHDWNECMNEFLISVGFKRCFTDSCVYVKTTKTSNRIIIGLFVDDLPIAYHKKDENEWLQVKSALMLRFKMKDIGECRLILGMRVSRDRKNKTLLIDNTVYINKILNDFGMKDCKPVSTPASMDIQQSTTDADKGKADVLLYQSMVGALNYLTQASRPDIAYAVNVLCRYASAPSPAHLIAAKHVMKYLRGTSELGLCYSGGENNNKLLIHTWSDADWAGDHGDRKSTTGYVVKINNCTISWSTKKQRTVALSTAEAEYMALSSATQEIIWTQHLLGEILNPLSIISPCTIYCDNQAALHISKDDKHHQRTKHIDIKHHFIREYVKDGFINIVWTPTEYQTADILTKALAKIKFNMHKEAICNSLYRYQAQERNNNTSGGVLN